MKKIALILIAASSTQHVYADDWVFVGAGYYVLRESAEKNGDIATISFRHEDEGASLRRGVVNFDCKRKVAFGYGIKGTRAYTEDEPLGAAAKIACRSKWHFWK
jgi:hypothetical protein